MFCPFCGTKNPDGIARCLQCGGEIPVPGRQRSRPWWFRPGPGLGCMIGLATLGFLSLAIAVPQYILYQRHLAMARESVVRSNMRSLRVVMDQYAAEFGQYPVDFDARGIRPGEPDLREVRMMLSRMQNPFDPVQPAVVVCPSYPPDWRAVEPGQVVYVPRDTFNGWARNYLILAKGKKRPLPDSISSSLE
ncbi:zinc ribbon domain-containing protein [bacterium]|nr:zinc ribbon domain-containing protein [bacterium]